MVGFLGIYNMPVGDIQKTKVGFECVIALIATSASADSIIFSFQEGCRVSKLID